MNRSGYLAIAASMLLVSGGVAFWVLRPTPVKRLIKATEQELKNWAGGLKEDNAAGIEMIKRYWTQGARLNYPGYMTPWSAAFISYVANLSNPGSLPPAGSHMEYATKALRGEGSFRVYRSPGFKVRPGDLILRSRANSGATFDMIGKGYIETHVDVVTAVKNGYARGIGGNKANAVSVENYALDAKGAVTDPTVFAILRMV